MSASVNQASASISVNQSSLSRPLFASSSPVFKKLSQESSMLARCNKKPTIKPLPLGSPSEDLDLRSPPGGPDLRLRRSPCRARARLRESQTSIRLRETQLSVRLVLPRLQGTRPRVLQARRYNLPGSRPTRSRPCSSTTSREIYTSVRLEETQTDVFASHLVKLERASSSSPASARAHLPDRRLRPPPRRAAPPPPLRP